MPNKQADEFIAKLYPGALEASKATGMSWQLMLAQAAQETGWGKHMLEGTNNIFNIKADSSWKGPSKVFHVWEIENGKKVWRDDSFRVYADYKEAFQDRTKFLQDNPRYAPLFKEGIKGNFVEEAKALQKAGYATDPHYADNLIKVFNGPTMQHAIKNVQEQLDHFSIAKPLPVHPLQKAYQSFGFENVPPEMLKLHEKIVPVCHGLNSQEYANLTAYTAQRMHKEGMPLNDIGEVHRQEFRGKDLLVVTNTQESKSATADIPKAIAIPAEQTLAAMNQPVQAQEHSQHRSMHM